MKKYRLRPGVVLTEICGEYLLVATPQAEAYCKFVNRVNETGGKILEYISHESLTISEIGSKLNVDYEVIDKNSFIQDVFGFLISLQENGYIVTED